MLVADIFDEVAAPSTSDVWIIAVLVLLALACLVFRKALARFARTIPKTKLLIAASALLLLYSIANPPWRITVKNHAGHIRRTELVWSYLGDAPRDPSEPYQSTAIATDVFAIQTIAVLVAIAAAFALIRAPQDAKPKPAANLN